MARRLDSLGPWLSLAALTLSLACGNRVEIPQRPNILLVLADDMGYGDLQTYNPDSKIPMPNLERLAREGLRFTDAHSPAAVCAPTRYSVVTGNYPFRGRIITGVWRAWGEPMIRRGQMTLAELLKDAGYRSGKVGKHHLGGRFKHKNGRDVTEKPNDVDYGRRFAGGPTDRGFDFSFIVPSGIQEPPFAFFRNDRLEGDVAALRRWEPGKYGNSEIARPGDGVADWDSSEVGPRVLDEALGFLRAHHERNEAEATSTPFFLYYSAVEAHWPWTPAESLRGHPVRGVTGLSRRADLLYQLDLVIGELSSELERLGLLSDTLVIVTSDNGGDIATTEPRKGHSAVGHLAGGKGQIAEGGHRVPLVMRWGDGEAASSPIAPGGVSAQTVGLQDLFATIAELVGVDPGPDQGRDSFSFLPVLLGWQEESRPVRDHLIVQDKDGPSFGFREGEWKLVLDRQGRDVELLRVAPDGTEQDAAEVLSGAEYRDRRAAMRKRFAALRTAPRTAPAASPGAARI